MKSHNCVPIPRIFDRFVVPSSGMRGCLRGFLLFLCLCPIFAFGAEVRLEGSTLVVNGSPVLTLRYGNAGKRLQTAIKALENQGSVGSARAVARAPRALLLLGDTSILRVEPQDAAKAKMSTLALAKIWAGNINTALTLPPLKLGKTSIQLGSGSTTKVPFSGRLASSASVESSDEGVATVQKESGNLIVTAHSSGTSNILVSTGENIYTLRIKVVPIAANFPQFATANVTGFPCTNATAQGAIENAIWNQLRIQPSADLKFKAPEIGQIPIGESRTVTVPVRATAPDCLAAEGNVVVTIRNTPARIDPESELWYCNFPEQLKQMGQVFGGRLKSGKSVRMLYHHINEMGKGLLFHAQVVNTSDQPAQILLIPGDSPTDKNPVLAGIEAADRFLRNWIYSSGEIVNVPPRTSIPISFRRLAPKETVSGLIYLCLLSGGPESVTVRADVKPTFTADGRWASALASDAPWRVLGAVQTAKADSISSLLSEHIYPEPFKHLNVSYSVGGRHGFVRIGQQPIKSSDGLNYLDGNFGVVYTIKANVENPTDSPANVEVAFEASAGYSGALFVINGQVHRTPLLQPKDETQVLRLRLEAGAQRSFTLQTIPLSGGSYPATLSIRTVERGAYSRSSSGKK